MYKYFSSHYEKRFELEGDQAITNRVKTVVKGKNISSLASAKELLENVIMSRINHEQNLSENIIWNYLVVNVAILTSPELEKSPLLQGQSDKILRKNQKHNEIFT